MAKGLLHQQQVPRLLVDPDGERVPEIVRPDAVLYASAPAPELKAAMNVARRERASVRALEERPASALPNEHSQVIAQRARERHGRGHVALRAPEL